MKLQRILAIMMLVAAAFLAATFSYAQTPVAVIGLVVAGLVIWRSQLIYFVVAVIIPTMDLTPSSGRFYVNEFDIWLLAAIGGALWSSRFSQLDNLRRVDKMLLAGVMLSYLASVVVAFIRAGSDGGICTTVYDHPFNSLRLAKSIGYAGAIWGLLFYSETCRSKALHLFAWGTVIGLASTVVIVALERTRFCGLLDIESEFRVTGPFADMHVGDAALDNYLVMSIPLLAYVWRGASAIYLRRIGLAILLLGAIYATCVTVSRAPIVIVALQALGLACVWFYQAVRVSPQRWWQPITFLLLVLGGIGIASTTQPLQKRFSHLIPDTVTRWNHCRQSFDMLDGSWQTELFGIGCGGYAKEFRRFTADGRPSNYELRHDGGVAFVRLSGSEPIYFCQYVSSHTDTQYKILLRGRRVNDQGSLTISLGEKSQLYAYDSVELAGILADTSENQWADVERELNSKTIGRLIDRSPFPPMSRPVAISFWASDGAIIDVDILELLDDDGNNLIENSDFKSGHDRWWWTSDDHLIWHAKNLWVHLRVENGWLGVLAFAALMIHCSRLLLLRFMAGDLDAFPLACALLGVLAMGMISSVVDSPRISLMVMLIVGFAIGSTTIEKKKIP